MPINIHMAGRRVLSVLILSLYFADFAQARFTDCLRQKVASVLVSSRQSRKSLEKRSEIESLEELLQVFSQGLEPDLLDASQRNAFEVYRRMRLGDPNVYLPSDTMPRILEEITKHPELQKEPLRNYRLLKWERTYPVTKALSAFLDSQVRSAGQVRSNLFQIDANAGYWKKVFQYEEPSVPKGLEKSAAKAFRERSTAQWANFLEATIPGKLKSDLINPEVLVVSRAKSLYGILNAQRLKLKQEGKDLRPISQAIADLVHTLGYADPEIVGALKSPNGLERISGYRRMIQARDSLAAELGFKDGFPQLLKELSISVPTGVPSVSGLAEHLKSLEDGVVAESDGAQNRNTERLIRHLSLAESPYRSCLGGDCASRTYLTKAFDPNYHYFTLTDEMGASSGHVTIVLGEAKIHRKKVKVAFVDKIQNVPNEDLPWMLEGIRQSVHEKGYLLALPDDLGDHNGISNEEITRLFVKKGIKVDEGGPVQKFKPHAHGYDFPNAYSRADSNLPSHLIKPLSEEKDIQLAPGLEVKPWLTKKVDLERIVLKLFSLKNSPNLEERQRYLSAMGIIKSAGLSFDPEFESTTARWLGDLKEPIQLRKQVLLYEWTNNSAPLHELLRKFSATEQIQLIQNLMDTPRYKALILKDDAHIPDLIEMARAARKVRKMLLKEYASSRVDLVVPVMERVLDATDIGNGDALKTLRQIKTSIHSRHIDDMLKILSLVRGSSIERALSEDLMRCLMENLKSETVLGRTLVRALGDPNNSVRDFAAAFVGHANDAEFSNYQILKALKEITHLQKFQSEPKGFEQAAKLWVRSEGVPAELKAEFLLSSFGNSDASGKSLFDRYQLALPQSQWTQIQDRVSSRTNLLVFQPLIMKDSSPNTLELASLESFEFQAQHPGSGKAIQLGSPEAEAGRSTEEALHSVILTRSFEIQKTPITQLQWALVMGKNPSHFKKGGVAVSIAGKSMELQPNHPVENVSWNDVQKFIERLNKMDPKYNYRLPTEAEWEYAARAETNSAYWFGENSSDLNEYAWNLKNSGGKTHEVASRLPNPYGLYDMIGNVWEWVSDWHATDPTKLPSVDPQGPKRGSARSIRGGSWYSSRIESRSAERRFAAHPGSKENNIGFRLVRIPK